MINQVSTYSNMQTNAYAFSDFSQPQNGYFLSSPELEKQVKKEKSHKLGLTIATSAILVGFGVLAIMKGMPKGAVKRMDALHKFLENKITKLSQDAQNSRMAKIYKYFLAKVDNGKEYFNSINNATTFKDILFSKLTGKTKFTKKAAQKITNLFEKFSRNTVINGYSNAHYSFNRMYEVFGAADNKIIAQPPGKIVTINGKTLTTKEWLKEIAEKRLNMAETFNAYFGKNAVNSRYKQTKHAMDGLDKKVWDLSLGDVKGNFKNKELYDTFLPQAVLEKDKFILQQNVNFYKNIIVGSNDKNGRLQEIMEIYKQLLPPEEFQRLQRYSGAAVKKLNRAVTLETDKFFDKLRDLKLGSAPTDVLSIITGLATVAAGLTKAEDNDDRISISLKYGIPALGTIATSLCLGAALAAGGKAFLYSTLSGFLMNQIGSRVDDFLEQRRESTLKTV